MFVFEDREWQLWFWLTGNKICRCKLSAVQRQSLSGLGRNFTWAVPDADLEAWYEAAELVRAAAVLGSLPDTVRSLAESIAGWNWDAARVAKSFSQARDLWRRGRLSRIDQCAVEGLPGWHW